MRQLRLHPRQGPERRTESREARRELRGDSLWRGPLWPGSHEPGETGPREAGTGRHRCAVSCRNRQICVGSGERSEYTTLRMPPAEVVVFARLDWNIIARRVFIDPVEGVIGLMSPSSDYEIHARATDQLMNAIADRVGIGAVGLGASRWYGAGVPEKRKAVEADCCFYWGKTYEAWYAAALESADARRAFEARTPPDLVVEVERCHGDGNKPGLYREIGVPEMWRLDADRNRNPGSVEFLDLQAEGGPAPMDASALLPLCTAALVQEAIVPARRGLRAWMRAIIDRAAAEAEAGPAAGMDRTG